MQKMSCKLATLMFMCTKKKLVMAINSMMGDCK